MYIYGVREAAKKFIKNKILANVQILFTEAPKELKIKNVNEVSIFDI